MEIEFGELIMTVGISQGIFFAILLLTSRKYKSRPNRYLACLTVTLVLIILRVGELVTYDWFIEAFEYFAIAYLIPPLLYLYIATSLDEKVPNRIMRLLFGPFLVFSMIHALISVTDLLDYDAFGEWLVQTEIIEIYLIALYIGLVAILSIQKVNKSSVSPNFKKWVYVNLGVFILLPVSLLLSELAEIWFDADYWNFIWIGTAMFLMGISYFGVQQLNLEQQIIKIQNLQTQNKAASQKKKAKPSKNHYDRLCQLMQEQSLYKDTQLNRGKLATLLGVSESTITRILKENKGQRLQDFINQYRIEQAKQMLDDTRFDMFSLEAIGKEVGFKSRSAFYETFKKSTGLTPGTYKKR